MENKNRVGKFRTVDGSVGRAAVFYQLNCTGTDAVLEVLVIGEGAFVVLDGLQIGTELAHDITGQIKKGPFRRLVDEFELLHGSPSRPENHLWLYPAILHRA